MRSQPVFISAVLTTCLVLCSCAKEQPTAQDDSDLGEAAASTEKSAPAEKKETPKKETAAKPQKTQIAEPASIPYHNPLTAEQKAEGWLSLFDGHSLFGWESTDSKINWTVEDGAIVADSGPIGFLMTTVPYADYELLCEYRMDDGGNSGLFLRSEFPPGDISTECFEVNIADEHPDGFTTGALVNRQKIETPVERKEGWNEFRIKVDGSDLEVKHNGEVVLNHQSKNNVAASGRIGLQKNAGKIEFRKILVKPLKLKSLFNGKDLAGWREVPGSKSEFNVENGEIHVKDGAGFIETEETYKDFIFQAEAISHAAELNSGFFFRAMKGTEENPSNGYEYQIHNGFEGDRSHPNNSGTGAIFRRAEARYVVANDEEWFNATLIAYGPRISCWVDGYHVVDWVDERKPDPNPRRGLRLEAGHLSIQGHDPTTDLSFRNLKVVEYPSTKKAGE